MGCVPGDHDRDAQEKECNPVLARIAETIELLKRERRECERSIWKLHVRRSASDSNRANHIKDTSELSFY